MNGAAPQAAVAGTPASVIVFGIVFLAIGIGLSVWPRWVLDRYHGLLSKMRGLPLVEWEMGTLRTRGAVIFVRVFGALVIMSGLSMLFVYGGLAGGR